MTEPLDPAQLKMQRDAINAVDAWVANVVGCQIRGIIASLPTVPGEVLLASIGRALATHISQMYVGQPDQVRKYRHECVRGFKAVLTAAPVMPKPTPLPPMPAPAKQPNGFASGHPNPHPDVTAHGDFENDPKDTKQ